MTTPADWVQQAISKLLTDSHIHFPNLPGISLGPGPIDQFSTDFDNTFPNNVTAVVAGEKENFDGLKKKFLALRQHYDPKNSQFVQLDGDSSPEVNGSIVSKFSITMSREWLDNFSFSRLSYC